MTGRDFRKDYIAEQLELSLPQSVKERIAKDAANSAEIPCLPSTHEARPRNTMRRWAAAIGIAASIAAIAIGSIALSPIQSPITQSAGDQNPFQIVAFASEQGERIASDEGLLVFNESGGYSGGADEGVYTGALFSIEGDGISSVDYSLSKGELYRYAERRYCRDYGKEHESLISQGKLEEASALAHGVYQEAVERLMAEFKTNEEPVLLPESSSDGYVYTLSAALRVGSQGTLTLPSDSSDADAKRLTLGFWIPKAASEGQNPSNPAIRFQTDYSAMNGALLELTLHFENGSTATKAYEIRFGYLKCDIVETEDGTTALRARPEIGDPETDQGIHTLYAIELSSEAGQG